MLYRYRHEQKAYDRLPKAAGCPFCEPDNPILNPKPRRTVKQTANFSIISNMFPYRLWEHLDVTDHLLVVPKRHINSLRALTVAERKELMDIFCEYEPLGYSNYTRPPGTVARSLPHI